MASAVRQRSRPPLRWLIAVPERLTLACRTRWLAVLSPTVARAKVDQLSFCHILGWIILAIAIGGGLYTVAAVALLTRLMAPKLNTPKSSHPTASVLKPLYGAEAGLEAALLSTLEQDYPAPVQFVFGVHAADDPACRIVEQLRKSHPEHDIALVCDPARHGSNAKVSNLINMMTAAKHDIIVVADSDIAVPGDWLSQVVAALAEPGVGIVSCLYAGEGRSGAWSRLAAMAVSYNFLPNAAAGIGFGLATPCFGSTMALNRQILSSIGGFERFANLLADDYELGQAVRMQGLRIAYPPLILRHFSGETGFDELLAHELRWARTIRTIDPRGHWGSFVTHALPLGLIGAVLAGFTPSVFAGFTTILAARLFLKARIDHIVGIQAGPAWALPLRDMLSFALFLGSLSGSAVRWRGARLRVGRDGAMS